MRLETGWSALEESQTPGDRLGRRREHSNFPPFDAGVGDSCAFGGAVRACSDLQTDHRAGYVTHSRIIAGSRRGRRITMPPGDRTRPTTDRVREALFSAVAAWAGTAAQPAEESLAGLAFCDLYAGSGAVGLEAASRGASPVLLVERDPRTAQLMQSNAGALGLSVDIATTSVAQLLRRPPAQAFDVVFADPPYELETTILSDQLEQLVANFWVAAGSLIVVERSRRSPDLVWPAAAAKRWSRAYGETILSFGSLEPDTEGSS
jgi:16S rRNA (guanine966-N2)-methyltransferase